MDPADYSRHDATALAALVRSRQVSPSEVLDAALEVIAEKNPSLNAVIRDLEPAARRDLAAGLPDGPFTGVPFLVKDLGANVAGAPTTNGSALFAGAEPATRDSVVIERYRRAGLVIVGKTNTPEFGLAPSTEPVLFGPTRNPFDLERSAGGSSGGSAAAVAAGMVPVAHASDGGGSIRIPASCCGLFGLKPTRGRVTYAPERAEGWAGMSTQHAVTRSVRDSAALLDATAGPAPGDPYWPAPPATSFLAATRQPPGPLRVGLALTAPNGAEVHPECRDAAAGSASFLEALGHHVEPVEWTFGADLLGSAQAGIIAANTAATVAARLAQLGRELAGGDLEPVTAAMVAAAARTTAVDYVNAVTAAQEVGRHLAELFARIDVLVTPTLACLPPELGQVTLADIGQFMTNVAPMVAFTAMFNMSGQPAASLPLHKTGAGMAVGTQIVGRYGDEATLLSLCAQVEGARPWL
jgi:amidase